MSTYWNRIMINKLLNKNNKDQVKYTLSTKIGRFYFYFNKDRNNEQDVKMSGKIVFFPAEK